MLPGVAPGRGPPPGRGGAPPGAPPGRGAAGRGMGRSTGCCVENGLFPTRGVRAAGLGAPGTGPGRGPAAGLGATGSAAVGAACAAGAATGSGAAGGGAGTGAATGAGLGPAGLGAAGAAFTSASGVGLAVVATAPLPCAFAGAGFDPPNDSRSRRATGASTVEDADFTNSPWALNRARTSLLDTPSSLANSCTRALPATTSPV
jgi:hypothetical protein